MDKIKQITSILWIPIAGVALWLVYKLFVENEDDELDITSGKTGLSPADISIYNQVVANLKQGGNPYEVLSMLVPGRTNDYAQAAVRLGELLDSVDDKPRFAKVFAKKRNKLLTSEIVEVYGDQVYSLISQNVPNFQAFIL